MIETRENSSEKKSAKRAAVTVSVPASTANLGPGFDSFALALDLRNRFTFEFMDEPVAEPIILTRAIAGLETDRRNFVFRAFESCWACDPAMLNRLRIEIDARIPIGSGLGSSASCAAAAAIAATALSGAASEPAHLVRLAGAFEGHPDNVCAQIVGGFVGIPLELHTSIVANSICFCRNLMTVGFPFEGEPTVNSPGELTVATSGSHNLRRRSNG